MTVLKYDDIIKNNVILDTILVFFERVYVIPHSCKVSWSGLNMFRIYDGGTFSHPAGYLMSKKPRLVRVKLPCHIIHLKFHKIYSDLFPRYIHYT